MMSPTSNWSAHTAMPDQEIPAPLGTSAPVAFLATANAARSRQFYTDVLQLRLASDEAFALVFDCNGVMLRIQKVDSVRPAPHTSLGWHTSLGRHSPRPARSVRAETSADHVLDDREVDAPAGAQPEGSAQVTDAEDAVADAQGEHLRA